MVDQKRLVQLLDGKSIFLTGTTGYVGKLVLEKLIRNFSNVKCLYLIVRSTDAEGANRRLQTDVLNADIFKLLRDKDPEAFDSFVKTKIKMVQGDISKFRYGMSKQTYRELCENIDIIFNIAATVKFYDLIDNSLQTNALFSAFNIANLSKNCQDAPVIHVSTCYVNGYNSGEIKEEPQMQPPRKDPDFQLKQDADGNYDIPELIKTLITASEAIREDADAKNLSEKKTSERLVKLGSKMAKAYGWNDIYTFTKWLGEMKLMMLMKGKNLSIVRPSVIESTFKDPIPGWIEGIKVGDTLIVGYVLGYLKVFTSIFERAVDLIPGDLVANSIFVAVYHALTTKITTPQIYQCCSSSSNPITVKQFNDYTHELLWGKHKGIYDLMGSKLIKRQVIWVKRWVFILIINLLKSWAKTLEILNTVTGNSLAKAAKRTRKLAASTQLFFQLFAFYVSPFYTFRNDHLMEAFTKLHPEDQKLFEVSPNGIDWYEYIDNHIGGLIKYTLPKEKKAMDEHKARKKAQQAR